MKIGISKGLRKICIVVLLCILFGMLTTSCKQSGETNNSALSHPTVDFIASMDNCELPNVLDYFNKHIYSSFFKFKITKIYDEIFVQQPSSPHSIILLEGKVTEILYDTTNEISVNKTEIIPVILPLVYSASNLPNENSTNTSEPAFLDKEKVVNWLLSLEYMYISLISRPREIYYAKNDTSVQIESNHNFVSLTLYNLIPATTEQVCVKSLDDFLQNNNVSYLHRDDIYGMNKICYDGIPCENFENYIMTISAYYDLLYYASKNE